MKSTVSRPSSIANAPLPSFLRGPIDLESYWSLPYRHQWLYLVVVCGSKHGDAYEKVGTDRAGVRQFLDPRSRCFSLSFRLLVERLIREKKLRMTLPRGFSSANLVESRHWTPALPPPPSRWQHGHSAPPAAPNVIPFPTRRK